jgi:hypothetical protein
MVSFLLLAIGLAEARPLPVFVVRPLPAVVRPVLTAESTKAEIIAASGVARTWSYLPLGAVGGEDGDWDATPGFTCTVAGGALTVGYLREGFQVQGVPRVGTCTQGKERVRFRIRLDLSELKV